MTASIAVRSHAVLIGKPEKEASRQKGWRIRDSLVQYIEKRAAGAHRGAEAEVVEDAITIHRELHESLAGHEDALQRFAGEQGLELSRDSGKLIARLVLLALEPYEKRKR